jgi:hypothetical protein
VEERGRKEERNNRINMGKKEKIQDGEIKKRRGSL